MRCVRRKIRAVLRLGSVSWRGAVAKGFGHASWKLLPVGAGRTRAVPFRAARGEGRPGHLTPSWMMAEMHTLAQLVNPMDPYQTLAGFPVVVVHIKPVLQHAEPPRLFIER